MVARQTCSKSTPV